MTADAAGPEAAPPPRARNPAGGTARKPKCPPPLDAPDSACTARGRRAIRFRSTSFDSADSADSHAAAADIDCDYDCDRAGGAADCAKRSRRSSSSTAGSSEGGSAYSPVWTLVGVFSIWVHGATVGVALGDSMLQRFFLLTVVFVLPVVVLWTTAKTIALRRLAASFVYFLCALQATAWSLSVAWYRNPRDIPTLPDLVHDLIGPKWDFVYNVTFLGNEIGQFEADMIPDIFLATTIISTLIFIFRHKLRWVVLRRVLFVYSTLMLFRCFTILVTSLPDSHPRCREVTPRGDLPTGGSSVQNLRANFREMVIRSLQVMIPIGEITCGDMVFSGHTLLIILGALVWHTYYPRSNSTVNRVKFVVWAWSFAGLFTIVATRLHYSLDVLLAWYLAVTVWSSYHRIANDVIRGRRFEMVWLLDSQIIYPTIEYFEEGVGREGLYSRHEMASPRADSEVSGALGSPR